MTAPRPIDPAPASADDGAWPSRKLALVGLVLFAGQVALVFATGGKANGPSDLAPAGPEVRWIPAAIDARTLATEFGVADPVGAVLPGPHGFSAEGWLRLPSLPQVRIDWVDATHWLALATNRLGEAYRLLPQEQRPLLAATGPRELPPTLQPPALPIPEPLRTASAAELEPALAARLEAPWPNLPPFTYDSTLKDSVVHLSVNEEGRVLTARLAERSGLPDADQLAVRTALNLSFRPQAASGVIAGRMRFRWHTQPSTGGPNP